jgi:outer membrane protein OmpA-like peptidoglycan-associated protein
MNGEPTMTEATTVQAAPRGLVEDAWHALNRKYAIGAGVLAALLLLLWLVGAGPGAMRAAGPGAATPAATADAPAATPRPEAASPATAPAGRDGSGAVAGSGQAANAGAAAGAAASPSAAAEPSTDDGAQAAAGAAKPAPPGAGGPVPVPGAPVARLYFEPNQAWPTGEVGPRLAPVLARLKADPDTKALVRGFHDRRGSAELNEALAQRRAQTVRRILIREGVAADRIVLVKPQQTKGGGSDREARRVEVTVAR